MSNLWIKIDDLRVNLENIPGLLDRYNILPDFLRRLLETKLTHDIKPKKEEQINFFKTLLLDPVERRIYGRRSKKPSVVSTLR